MRVSVCPKASPQGSRAIWGHEDSLVVWDSLVTLLPEWLLRSFLLGKMAIKSGKVLPGFAGSRFAGVRSHGVCPAGGAGREMPPLHDKSPV